MAETTVPVPVGGTPSEPPAPVAPAPSAPPAGLPEGGQALHPAGPSLFAGMPPLLMMGLGVVIGAAISFAVGVVVWSVFG